MLATVIWISFVWIAILRLGSRIHSARKEAADIDAELLELIRMLTDQVSALSENQEEIMAALADTHAVQETRVFIPYTDN